MYEQYIKLNKLIHMKEMLETNMIQKRSFQMYAAKKINTLESHLLLLRLEEVGQAVKRDGI